MNEKYYFFTFLDSFDDGFGGNHKFTNEIALSEKSFLYPKYNENHITKEEITKERYDEWNEDIDNTSF